MIETTKGVPPDSFYYCESENCDSDCQVETISIASHEDLDTCCCAETTTSSPANQLKLPYFKAVSIVNSNDVHFGNKTVYKGPVNITQYVYPNGEIINNEYVTELDENACKTDLKQDENGIYNPSFINNENEIKITENDKVGNTNTNKSELHGSTKHSSLFRKINEGFHCCLVITESHRYEAMICTLVVIVTAIIVSTLLIYNYPMRTTNLNKSDSENNEEDQNVPISFSKDPSATFIHPNIRMIKRLQWLAQPPTGIVNNLTLPVSMVIIQHTATENCTSQAECVFQTRTIQTYHIESNGWYDIGYNFLIGGDGAVYEGRGWTKEGAHTLGYNKISIGIAFIGTYMTVLPAKNMIEVFHKLLRKGVKENYLTNHYKIIAHRQLIGTESPGRAFFEEIKKWSHWSPN